MVEIVHHPDVVTGYKSTLPTPLCSYKEDKETTMLRVVHIASSKTIGPSLNDCLVAGCNIKKQIFDILVTFRAYPVAFATDIEKAL
uniref:Uncharacterized protein n=1 Tax=Amphimedon queenslandica TaxID=400682 RepID=A0A1X7UKG8_AMPQE